MRGFIMPSNLNATPSSSANACMSWSSCTFTRDGDRLERQRQLAFEQQVDAAQALVERARNAGQPLVGLPGPAVERDLDRERAPHGEIVGDSRRDQRAVREEGDEEALLLRVGVDVEEIAAREDLAAGEQQPEASGIGQLVEDPAVLLVAELGARRLVVRHRQIVVAVDAGQRAPSGHLDGAAERQVPLHGARVKGLAELAVADGFHRGFTSWSARPARESKAVRVTVRSSVAAERLRSSARPTGGSSRPPPACRETRRRRVRLDRARRRTPGRSLRRLRAPWSGCSMRRQM